MSNDDRRRALRFLPGIGTNIRRDRVEITDRDLTRIAASAIDDNLSGAGASGGNIA